MKSKAAVVLAAGYSSRMGAFKPLLDVGGKPAIERALDALRDGGISEIVAVTGHNRELLLPYLGGAGIFEAYNPNYNDGMFSSLTAGIKKLLEISMQGPAGFFVMPVDYAAVNSDIIKLLLNSGTLSQFTVPCYFGKKGHPLWIPAVYIDELLSYSGGEGLKSVTRKYDGDMARVETGKESVVLDMDTPSDYEELLAYWERGRAEEDIKKLAQGRRFIFIRHGQIRQHEKKIFLGQNDIPLSELGREQAMEAAFKLGALALKTSLIYSSDLLRAKETAEIILGELKEKPGFNPGPSKAKEKLWFNSGPSGEKENPMLKDIALLKDFREMSLGPWDGKYIDEIKSAYPLEFKLRGEQLLTYKCGPGAENFYDLQYRAVKALKKILKADSQKDIIIVAHSGTIQTLAAALSGIELSKDILEMKIAPDAVHIVEIQEANYERNKSK